MAQQDKRRRILDAAVTVFARNGFYSSKVAHIAREAGVADGTIYLYFKNKEDLLIQVFLDSMELALDRQSKALVSVEDPAEKLEIFIRTHFDVVSQSPAFAEVLTVELRQSGRFMHSTDMTLFGRYLGVIARLVAQGQEKGAFNRTLDPRRVARALFGALDELALEWATSNPRPDIEDIRDQTIALFLGGVRAR